MSNPLQGDQYPKGLTEEEVRAIAREEAANALGILAEEVASTGSRADGNLNARDFQMDLELTEKKMRSKE